MKNSVLVVSLLLFLFSCNTQNSKPDVTKDADKTEMNMISLQDMQIINYAVEGMTCNGCENAINKSVNKLAGIIEVTSSHIDKSTIVKFDRNQTTIEIIKKKIEAVGYVVTGINSDINIDQDTLPTNE